MKPVSVIPLHRDPPPPPPMPDITWSINTGGKAGDWQDWRTLYGGGLRQWLRWFFSDADRLPEADQAAMRHIGREREGYCHIYQGSAYCYCGHPWHARQARAEAKA